MIQDESFLPDTTMPAFSYRDARGNTIPNYPSNTGSSVLSGFDTPAVAANGSAILGILVGGAIAAWGLKSFQKGGSTKNQGAIALAVGLAVAYLGGVKKLNG